MSKWIPTPAYYDFMPVDISFVFEDEKPAGKFGFLKREGNHFCFENGRKVKFWGVCLAGAANFPEHDYAEKLARRLAQSGINCVRMHWMDTQFDTPNIFAFTKGKRVYTTRKLDENSLDRMDYLIYALKKQGIYIYLDNLTFRKFKEGDGVVDSDKLADAAKPYVIFDPHMRMLQKEYMTQLWTHHNPYTGLAPKDDPAIVLTEIINETDIFAQHKKKWYHSPYYDKMFKDMFAEWLKKNNIEYDCENVDFEKNDKVILDFKLDVTREYYEDMTAHLRKIGVKIPITGTTWSRNKAIQLAAHKDMDFTDAHHYYYDWRFTTDPNMIASLQINGNESVLSGLGVLRDSVHPYFVSEWDMPWPNDFRAESPIYYAAVSGLQDWDGIALFGYAHGSRLDRINIIRSEFSTDIIAGLPFEAGVLSSCNDPAKFGLFYHAALIVRRGDIQPADKLVGVKLNDYAKVNFTAYRSGLEISRMASVLDGAGEEKCDTVIDETEKIEREDANVIAADNNQHRRYLRQKVGVVDTPRTKVIYGTLAKPHNEGARMQTVANTDGFSVACRNDFGVFALSSLTDEPTETSDNMLLSAIGRARNTDMVGFGDEMRSFGHAPISSEVLEASVKIRTDRTDLKVWGVNPEGYYVGQKKAEFKDGYMTFTVGDKFNAIYYLIVAE